MTESLLVPVDLFAREELEAAAEEFHLKAAARLFNKQDAGALKAIGLLMYLDVLAARPDVMRLVVERLRAALRAALLDD